MDTGSKTGTGRWARRGMAIVLMGGTAAVVAASAGPASGDGWSGRAVLRDVAGAKVATVRFEGTRAGTEVRVVVDGVTVGLDAFHGLHVHANDAGAPCDPATAFANVGGHWTTAGATHGHHDGDLPSLLIQADGSGTARSITGRFDPGEVDGRAVILHAGPDNFANIPTRYGVGTPPVLGPDAATLATGDSGGRIACGIIDVS